MMVNQNGGKEIYYLGFYEVGTLHVIDNCLRPDDNFIDVGASIGLMSIFAAKKINDGIVLSFEPQKERYEILKRNMAINGRTNIQAFNNGLGEVNQQLKLYTDVFSPSIIDIETTKGQFEMIDILILDEILESKKIDVVKFIKIDVEGFEISVLRGAKVLLSGKHAPIICVEYVKRLQNLNNTDVTIFNFITSINNYRIFQLEKSSNTISKLKEVHHEKDLRDFDNMYCFTENNLINLNSDKLFKKSSAERGKS
ncbi:MAG: FkbM family methyltransferase [Bacteroidales bacterium]|nr:FkbM family methyltransferase [Bacteroidales bacterium]